MNKSISFKHKVENVGSRPALTVSVLGELNAFTATDFEQEIRTVFSQKNQDIFLDLSQVNVFVSAAIGSLMILHDDIVKKGFQLRIVKDNEKVKSILQLTGLDTIFRIERE